MKKSFLVLITLFFGFTTSVLALPVDWNGTLGYDNIRINNYKRTNQINTAPNSGSQEIAGLENDAFVQTYLFRLAPSIIVNDHVTLKAELSTGHPRGGAVGDNTSIGDSNDTSRGLGAAHFYHTAPASTSALRVGQTYMEVYSDIATLKIGRYSKHWGLGILLDDGSDATDRFYTYYEGFEARFAMGNIYITPHWLNLSTQDEFTRGGEVRELGISLLYDNPDKDTQFGLLTSKRKTGSRNSVYKAQHTDGVVRSMGSSEVTLMDFFYQRYWSRFRLGAEVSLLSGTLGNVYDTSTRSDIKASAYVVESDFDLNEKWKIGLKAGVVTGDDGASDAFEALYLNPNYQVAEIMFRYNLKALGNSGSTQNLYDSAVSNASFLRLNFQYKTGAWTWNMAYIYAKARETAVNGQRAYHHEESYAFTAAENQKDDLGQEIDLTFDYQWNPNLTFTGVVAYFMPGDYFKYTNGGSSIDVKNQLASGFKVNLNF